MSNSPDIRYFIYSKEQFKHRTEIENKIGKKFYAGTLIVHGRPKKFTQIVTNIDNVRYPDFKIIAHTDIHAAKYTEPYAE